MIGLVDFLKASGVAVNVEYHQVKIHLACWNGHEHPIDVYYAGRFKEWQEHQAHRNFSGKQVLALIDLRQRNWLFAGVYEVLGFKQHPEHPEHFLYSTKLLPDQESLIGRVIVHHERSRASYIWNTPEIALPIVEVRREKLTVGEFPGYNWVILSHAKLKVITDQKVASWHGALANIKGVYLITDTSTGKHYVGKASGDEGIWQRWCDYAKNGHGGNVELKQWLKDQGQDRLRHFQYSILEIADTHASDNDILAREQYWISVLKSRDFGLNGGRHGYASDRIAPEPFDQGAPPA